MNNIRLGIFEYQNNENNTITIPQILRKHLHDNDCNRIKTEKRSYLLVSILEETNFLCRLSLYLPNHLETTTQYIHIKTPNQKQQISILYKNNITKNTTQKFAVFFLMSPRTLIHFYLADDLTN